MATSLADKVVWLTGATSGIGEALAYELSAKGAKLILTARREDELHRVRSACRNSDQHFVLPLDLLDRDRFAAPVGAVLDHFGHVDVIIHCAGISQRGAAVDTEMKVFEYVDALNYLAPVALTKLLLPSMIARKSGHVVAISSLLGKFGAPRRSAYCASKHAIVGFCDALRSEVYDHNIKVTVVCPGYVRTNASYNALDPDGAPHGKLDKDIAGGISSDVCARQIVRAIEAGKREVYLGRKRWAVYLARFFPGTFNHLVRLRGNS